MSMVICSLVWQAGGKVISAFNVQFKTDRSHCGDFCRGGGVDVEPSVCGSAPGLLPGMHEVFVFHYRVPV